jgi:hypothetical protein
MLIALAAKEHLAEEVLINKQAVKCTHSNCLYSAIYPFITYRLLISKERRLQMPMLFLM